MGGELVLLFIIFVLIGVVMGMLMAMPHGRR